MTRLAVKVAYMGEGFSGSQTQPGLRTVEGEISSNLETICDSSAEELDLKLASRTDRGVNALGNVAVFSTEFRDCKVLLKALNAVSRGVYYRSYAPVPDDFNPRYANLRKYRYVMPSDGIDLDRARGCASVFVGEHDFVRFCKYDNKPTIGRVESADVWKDGGALVFDCSARFFLWNQVRRMMSAIASVGRGDAETEDVLSALNGDDISFGVARADALTLRDVVYEGLDFSVPDAAMFDTRVKEELFRSRLKESFFNSL
ncbi:MAG: tRNA pseudouridine(38-40) synthase TruA [Candidatus Methanomethylophilaceae archaeon]|mgnify:FL=1|jgi:tRNA pseudouridine38-40 synthase|nr:tRNA pseudouridine(38-40) synthase TruA [Candidatus Methanomethylophilaceae archaeon]MDD2936032.1 tRNA pseudouridine(38-40) synthase TruA [Candidatus Methanomethylophilaceae archaeon]MDD3351215.1 tRNA pseudouridine(38-40) synthase TruA [Candidatus Methanomethylophilaceae archaeon]MDD3986761.1 tRNA pseudouridine(38-40) synthase TruA [Candidatus Methanomethylophilaceae archaeon]MDD4709295.1 tRNA pseudouridine(38-40) synthase TruA [Candidatus Methanomethylophilaceae archaeon]